MGEVRLDRLEMADVHFANSDEKPDDRCKCGELHPCTCGIAAETEPK